MYPLPRTTARTSSLIAVAAAATLVVAGCGGGGSGTTATAAEQALTSAPTGPTVIIEGSGPAALALATSQALFDRAPVLALAAEDDAAATRAAGELAEAVGAPLLLVPAEAAASGAELAQEVRRLDPQAVVAFDDTASDWADQATAAPVLGAEDDLPPAAPADPLADLLVLTTGAPEQQAAAATARAAGARVLPVAGGDPRGDPAAVEALTAAPAGKVAALGGEFGPPEQLRQRLEVAETGVQLPGGGQTVFPGRRMIALYGHPGATELGALGEQALPEALARTQEAAAAYQDLVTEPVVPVFEIITTVASSQPGPNGDYSVMTPVEALRPWVEAAAEAGVYVVLDLQPGRTDFLTQAREYEELLRQPHVGLALDPEWRLAPDQVHLAQIGSVSATEVNQVSQWLAELTREHRLPQKLLVLHQFRLSMITDREQVETGHDELAVLVHADGHGTEQEKLATWDALRAEAQPDLWWGWKNFYDEDRPMLTPEQTVAVEPLPWFVSYQ